MTSLKPILQRLALGETLTEQESAETFGLIMQGMATPSQIGAFLMALHIRGETISEMTGALHAMRTHMKSVQIPDGAIDIVGTGGDAAGTLNVSTATSIVVAACGVPVAKHGNKAQSSKSGTADVLAELGVILHLPLEKLPEVLTAVGMVFLLAPNHHPALGHAAGPRSELGIRTIFNLVAPLANPARVRRQLTGAYSPNVLRPMADTLRCLGTERAWLVHGQGIDELTLAGSSQVVELRDGKIREFEVHPEDCGLALAPIEAIRGGSPSENAASLLRLLSGELGPYRDCVLLNAAAALVVADRCVSLREGIALAAAAIDSGQATSLLARLRSVTQALSSS
jgi:anthranilate phosphoribosyltransferase